MKKKRVCEGIERLKWTKKHGRDTYSGSGASDVEQEEGDPDSGVTQGKGKRQGNHQDGGNSQEKPRCGACGSSTHQRSNHKDCPFNKGGSAHAKKESNSVTAISVHERGQEANKLSGVSSDAFSYVDYTLSDVCDDDSLASMFTCGAAGRAHKRGCPMSSRQRYPAHSCFLRGVVSEGSPLSSTCGDVLEPGVSKSGDLDPPPPKRSKIQTQIGDYVSIHSKSAGDSHVPCRIVGGLVVGISCTAQRGF